MAITFEFEENPAGNPEGFVDSGIETFRGAPLSNCARETGQNSCDAAAGKEVVVLNFELLQIPRTDLPCADEIQRRIELCLKTGPDKKKDRLQLALAAIKSRTIRVLKITDSNTKGLAGPPDDPSSPFAALVKGDGVSYKDNESAGGSYGIGKKAVLAISSLQMVLYSTRYRDSQSGEICFAAQGRTRFTSHSTEDGKRYHAHGYWGQEGFKAITDDSLVPQWLVPEQVGTSIFAIAFNQEADWVNRIKLSLITNFFSAIYNDRILFTLDRDKHVISKSTLANLFEDEQLVTAADVCNMSDQLERARLLMRCLTSGKALHHTISVPGLGDFTLHALIAEKEQKKDDLKLPREVHFLRNGIYICKGLPKFPEKLKRFSDLRAFIAIVEPSECLKGEKSSELLRRLENPSHDAFEPDRISPDEKQNDARKHIADLSKQIRDFLKKEAAIEIADSTPLTDLSQYFEPVGSKKNDPDTEDNKEPDPVRIVVIDKPQKHGKERSHPFAPTDHGDKLVADPNGNLNAIAGGGHHQEPAPPRPAPPTPPGPGPTPRTIPAQLSEVRAVMADKHDPCKRMIFFTPSQSGPAALRIDAAGLTDDVPLEVAASSLGTINKGAICLDLTRDERTKIEITLSEPFPGPVQVTVCAITKAAMEVGK